MGMNAHELLEEEKMKCKNIVFFVSMSIDANDYIS